MEAMTTYLDCPRCGRNTNADGNGHVCHGSRELACIVRLATALRNIMAMVDAEHPFEQRMVREAGEALWAAHAIVPMFKSTTDAEEAARQNLTAEERSQAVGPLAAQGKP